MTDKPLIQQGKANIVIDGQWGSTGKGKLVGYLASTEKIDFAVCDFMPNAGHTYARSDGKAFITRQLPTCAAFGMPCLIGPHASIDLALLLKEIEENNLPAGRLFIHPLAAIVQAPDIQAETESTSYIAGTRKGGHHAQALKTMRASAARLAQDCPDLAPWIGLTHEIAQRWLRAGRTGLIETAQGFDLGLNHGHEYPYTTGRDCLVGRALDNAGLPVRAVGSIILSLRTYPIRVGDIPEGTSGPCHGDQRELTWDQLSEFAGRRIEPEMTTVTKRVRRIFTFSREQVRRACEYIAPTHAFLNFVNYWPKEDQRRRLAAMSDWLGSFDCRLALAGTGARNDEMIRL